MPETCQSLKRQHWNELQTKMPFWPAALAGSAGLSASALAATQARITKRSAGHNRIWLFSGSVVIMALAAWFFWPQQSPQPQSSTQHVEVDVPSVNTPAPSAPLAQTAPTIVQRSHTDSSVKVTVRRDTKTEVAVPQMPDDFLLYEIVLEDEYQETEPDLNLPPKPEDNQPAKSQHRVYEIANYRVVDYSGLRNTPLESMHVQPGGLSPAFSNTDQATDPLNRTEREHSMSYEQALELAIGHFAAERYRIAAWHFEDILAVYSDDVNAQFYLGMSAYHDNDFEVARIRFEGASRNPVDTFQDASAFYAALAADAAGMRQIAVDELQAIAKSNSFYAQRAADYLK